MPTNRQGPRWRKAACRGDSRPRTLASRPQLLDLTDPKACYLLAQLLEDVPLYNINLEILIDDILSQRHLDKLVAHAITTAFMGAALPAAVSDATDGGLQHPAIGDIDRGLHGVAVLDRRELFCREYLVDHRAHVAAFCSG